jgi:hypothetical protein
MTEWTPATPRELLDWLAIFVAPQCDTEERMRMYLGVRDAVVQLGRLRTADADELPDKSFIP